MAALKGKRPARRRGSDAAGQEMPNLFGTGSDGEESNSSEGKLQTQLTRQRLWQLRFPERRRAHHLAEQAVRKGLIPKAEACQNCGSTKRPLDKHHGSYAAGDVLRVIVWCRACHVRFHAAERRLARQGGG
jgi:hypothetical protein